MTHQLFDPWAPHPVVNKNICFGGGGGSAEKGYQTSVAPDVPDYGEYIKAMTSVGNELTGYGRDLYKWAQDSGVKISGIADKVSARAGALADEAGKTYTEMMAKWKSTYGPLYDAQAADAQRMIGNLPQTEEQYAGKQQADVAQAFDASKDANQRKLQSYGLKAPGSGAQALDNLSANQRGLAQVAAGEQGRLAARTEARTVAANAIQSGLALPGVANQASATELSAGNQEIGAPESAIATTTGAFAPFLASYNAAQPWMKTWGDTMATQYNQRLGAYSAMNADKAQAASANTSSGANAGSGIGSLAGGLLGSVAGSVVPGVGTALGGMLGSAVGGAAGKAASAAEGGTIPPANGDNFVDPSASPSQGAITDDVPARLNAGEFVLPKDVVAWIGEEKLQKFIQKARGDREKNTVAEPEMASAGAIDMQAPTFRSEGAQL
jgi:hypothetical protein